MRHIPTLFRKPASCALGLLVMLGCGQEPTPTPNNPVHYVDIGPLTTSLAGFAFDPEAYFWAMNHCGEACEEIPPVLLTINPLFYHGVVMGAEVAAFDPLSGETTPSNDPSTPPEGAWRVPGVASREEPYFLMLSGGEGLPEFPPEPEVPPTPASEYVPTLTLHSIPTQESRQCEYLEASALSKKGILDAVARHLTATEQATTVDDLLDPAKFGGVLVTWMHVPPYVFGGPFIRVPMGEISVGAEPGRVIHVDWAPPGSPDLPVELQPQQSERGFVVMDPSVSMAGVAVVLLPPGDAGKDVRVQALLPEGFPFAPYERTVKLMGGVGNYLPIYLAETEPEEPYDYYPYFCMTP